MRIILPLFVAFALTSVSLSAEEENLIAPGATVEKVVGGFGFTEGPAVDSKGDIYFVDDPNSKIYHWSVADKTLRVFVEKSEHANGMAFDKNDNLIACEGGTGCVVSYDRQGKRTVVAAEFDGKRFNKPNDLWIDPKGGIYFTDPVYGREFKDVQGGEHVYYILPDRSRTIRVVDDMRRPNGLVGTPDGKTLYITDEPARTVWRYAIKEDGTLDGKTLFAKPAVDGMALDDRGNVYVTESLIIVFDPQGKEIQRVKVPEVPANVCFGGPERKTLYITARTSLYKLEMNVGGAKNGE